MNISFKNISKHLKSMKVIILTVNNRPGSSLLHCILDGHKEICTLPIFYNYSFRMFENLENRDFETIIDRFIFMNPALFNSALNESKNLHKLGKNENESVKISIKKFKKNCFKLKRYFNYSKKDFFLMIHGATYLTVGRNILNCKIIFYHHHSLQEIDNINFLYKKKNVFLHLTREPKAGFFREIENLNKIKDVWSFDGEIFSNKNYNDPIRIVDRIIDNLTLAKKIRKYPNFFLLTFEQMHIGKQNFIYDLLRKLSVTTKNFKIKPTYYGKTFRSDTRSDNKYYLFRDNLELTNFQNKLSFLDKLTIDYFSFKKTGNGIYKKYNLIKNDLAFYFLSFFIIPFLIFKPFRYEIQSLIFNIKKLNILKIFMWLYAYLKKVYLLFVEFKNIHLDKNHAPKLFIEKYVPTKKNI